MCTVGNAIGMGIQSAGNIANSISGWQQADAYLKYVKNQSNATLENYRYQTKALKNRYYEEVEATNQQQQQVYLQNLKSKAAASASAASNGTSGNSLDNLFMGYDRATAISNYITERELRNKGLQFSDNMDSLRYNAMNSILGLPSYTNTGVSNLLTGTAGLFSAISKQKGSY